MLTNNDLRKILGNAKSMLRKIDRIAKLPAPCFYAVMA
jgi:hypothetical protein